MSRLETYTIVSVKHFERKVIIVEHWNRTIELCHSSNKHTMRIIQIWPHFTTTLALSIEDSRSIWKHSTSMRSHLLLIGSICHLIILIWVDRTTILALFINVSVIRISHWSITIDHLKSS